MLLIIYNYYGDKMSFIDIIKNYNPINEQEKADKNLILDLYNTYGNNLLLRDTLIAHITVSAWIVNKNMDKVLMNYHNIYKNWGWLGGHADGCSDLLAVAKKEIFEESGLKNIMPLSNDIISLEALPVVSHIKKGKFVSSHIHLNVTYLFMANENDKLIVNKNEGSGLKWVEREKAPLLTNEEQMKPIYIKLNKVVDKYISNKKS